MADGSVIVVGGTSGIGLGIARTYAARGRDVVITGRTGERCADVAGGIGGPGKVSWRALDLAEPHSIAEALANLEPVDHLVLAAIERDQNTIGDYDVDRAIRLRDAHTIKARTVTVNAKAQNMVRMGPT